MKDTPKTLQGHPMMRATLQIGVPRDDGTVDVVHTVGVIDITPEKSDAKVLKEIKPLVKDVLKTMREHIEAGKKGKVIMPEHRIIT